MTISDKASYLAKGDNLLPVSLGPDEQVVGSNQIITAARFRSIAAAEAIAQLFTATVWQHGGLEVEGSGRFFESVKVAAGSLPSTITVTPALPGYDTGGTQFAGHCPPRAADGNVLAAPAASFVVDTTTLTAFEDVPYADVAAAVYNVGMAVSVIPSKAEQNPRTGQYEFTAETAVLGVVAEPTTVAYNAGLNTTALTLANDTLTGAGSSLAGRTALAWFTTPQGGTTTALLWGTMTWSGTNNVLTVIGSFGQNVASVSADATLYRVCVLGPVVWLGAKAIDTDGVAWIANGDNDTAWDHDGQVRFPTVHGFLANFLRMSDPSDAGADLVSLPKVSIRPNDNEPGTARQIEVWKDAAGTLLAFAVDKDGNIYFDGDLTSTTPPFAIGVDDAVAGRSEALEVYHSESGGVGIALKGPILALSAETSTEGVRETIAGVSGLVRDVTPAAVDGELLLAARHGSAEVVGGLMSEWGEMFFGSALLAAIGSAAAAGHYDPHVDGAIGAALLGVGTATENAIGSFNSEPDDSNGGRKAKLILAGTRSDGAIVQHGYFLGSHPGTGTDDLSNVSLLVNDGAALSAVFNATGFDDFTLEPAGVGLQLDHIRGLSQDEVQVQFASNTTAGAKTLLCLLDVFAGGSAAMVAAASESRLSWRVDTTDPSNDYIAHIGAAPVAGGYEMRFYGFGTGVERLGMNLHSDGTYADDRVEIYSIGSDTPAPFTTQNRSPLQIVHKEYSAYGGIDIGSNVPSILDGGASSGINFLGIATGTLAESRLAGLRAHIDGDLGAGTYSGKLSLYVNDGSSTASLTYGVEIYSTGYVRSPGTATWASVTFGAPPTYAAQCGFDAGTAITNPAVGTYVLTFATPMTGASLNSVVFVQPSIGGGGGRGTWTSSTTLTCYLWTSAAVPVDADFHVACFGDMNLRVA